MSADRDTGRERRHAARAARRRRRTRWLLVVPTVGLLLIVLGVVGLEAIHPQLDDPADRGMVVDAPPLAMEDQRQCLRVADADGLAGEIRDDVPSGGRISSPQVHGCPSAFDGLEVTFVGEAIGEVLRRDGGAWLQVNDDAYALEVGPMVGHREHAGFNTGLSVWLPDGLHESVETVGRPQQRGDVLLLRGTIEQSDPDDGGGITLRADDLEVLADGTRIEPPLHLTQAIVAAVLAVAAFGALIWDRAVRRR